MSIIIRLQNLPINAKSADVRNFFGGLRIPDGGVHILGGDKGDAFIAFNSDEDGRLAIRKDGGKIKDSRIKLFLSSRMEMQHEVEKLTKASIDASSHKQYNLAKTSHDDGSRHKLSEQRKYSRSRSPHKYNDFRNNQHQRSRSPVGHRARSPGRKSRSPISKSFFQKRRSASPKTQHFSHSPHDWKNTEFTDSEIHPSQRKIQAELERRITEAIEKNSALNNSSAAPSFDNTSQGMYAPGGHSEPYPMQTIPPPLFMGKDFLRFPPPIPPFLNNSVQSYRVPEFQPNCMINRSQLEMPPPVALPEMFMPSANVGRQLMNEEFFITMSGFDPAWGFREVQMMLKGIFAPQSCIRWEIDDSGYKTGTVFVKLSNRDDFDYMIKKATFFFDERRITVSECPKFISSRYFYSNSEFQDMYAMPQDRDLCYMLKGLPFACIYEDVVNFFQGFEVADVVIFHGKDGRATGTGYVSFTNVRDFEDSMTQNGKKIGHRYIEMLPSTDEEMAEAKKKHSVDSDEYSFMPYSKLLAQRNIPPFHRPLCAVLTGLPFFTSAKKLMAFFSESGLKPYAIHITVNQKKCDGRAFVEFTNFRDFDNALKLHGNKFCDNIICVKQILFDEMTKILDCQKAKHHFVETPAAAEPALNVPEKVPYLWEPPDAAEEQEKVNIGKKYSRGRDRYKHSPNNRSGNRRSNLIYPTIPNRMNEPQTPFHPPPSREIHFFENFNPHINQNLPIQRNIESFPSFVDQNNPEFNPFVMNKPPTDFTRERIKFNFGNKQVFANTKTVEIFDPTKNIEEKVKLSKLSPEKETHIPKSHNKNLKTSPPRSKEADVKSRSPERKEKNSFGERNFKEKNSSDEKLKSRAKNDSFARSRSERESRRSKDGAFDSHHRSPPRSESESNRKFQDRSRECTVQLSNVSQSVTTQDLVDFLHEFDIYKDTLIRRYTDEGEPTGDVRVTFHNRQQAEAAIRSLNGCRLQGVRISMFKT